MYDKLEKLHDQYQAKTVVDSAFQIGNGNFLLKSSQTDPVGTVEELLRNREATAIRQLSEWGMKQFRCKFPRICKAVIPWEERGQRRLDLGLMVRLYNHQVSTIGMNQILTTFMPERSPEIAYFNYGAIDETGDVVVNGLAEAA